MPTAKSKLRKSACFYVFAKHNFTPKAATDFFRKHGAAYVGKSEYIYLHTKHRKNLVVRGVKKW